MLTKLRDRLIDDCRNWYRWWSSWVIAVGVFLNTWIAFDPGAVLWVWRMLPPELGRMLPFELVVCINIVLFLLAMAMRLTRQKALDARREAQNDQ